MTKVVKEVEGLKTEQVTPDFDEVVVNTLTEIADNTTALFGAYFIEKCGGEMNTRVFTSCEILSQRVLYYVVEALSEVQLLGESGFFTESDEDAA